MIATLTGLIDGRLPVTGKQLSLEPLPARAVERDRGATRSRRDRRQPSATAGDGPEPLRQAPPARAPRRRRGRRGAAAPRGRSRAATAAASPT